MHLTTPLILIASGILAAAEAPPNCTQFVWQSWFGLGLQSNEYNNITYVDTLRGISQHGLDNNSDSLLLTRYKNGTAFPQTQWQFFQCSDQAGHGYPPGYQPSDIPVAEYYGLIRPLGDEKRCLALTSSKDTEKGKDNPLVLASDCAKVPERYRTWFFEDVLHQDTATTNIRVFYANADTTALIKNTTHGEVVMRAKYDNKHNDAFQLIFGPPSV